MPNCYLFIYLLLIYLLFFFCYLASNSNSNNSSNNTKYRSKPAFDDSESDSDLKENIPSPPSTTPSKRLRGSPPTTPKNVRYITKELQRTKGNS